MNNYKISIGRMLVSCILLFSCITAYGAEEPTNYPEKAEEILKDSTFRVGLVLSGGGAKGIAHVGVIKALEDNDIPIDCVAGTSMGAIVGSLYACGYSPEEMMQLFTSESFKYWSSGTIDNNLVYYETQDLPTPQWLDINLGLKKGNPNLASQIIPSHLISPIPMNLEFLKLYGPYTEQCGGDFNKLFVPLRTVCSDVYHKHKIVCYDGSLGDAVRASMSFPLVFKPIELDGVLVYDGGIYDNFPVDVMHEDFNPDFMIGVSVSGPDKKPEPGNVYSQLEDMIIQNNNYDLPDDWGVKIQVPVLNFGVLDWGQAQTIYDIGYKTGLSMVDSIKSRCNFRTSPESVAERRAAFKRQTPILEFDTVSVSGATEAQAKYLANLFEGDKKKPITLQEVQEAYYQAVTDGKLADLLPQAKFGSDGKNTLMLQAKVKKPWNIGVGGWITSSTQSQLYLSFGYHTLTFNSLNVDVRGWVGQSYYAGMLSARISLPTVNPSSLVLSGVISLQKYYETELMFYQETTPSFINETQEYLRLQYNLALGRPAKFYTSLSFGQLLDSYFLDVSKTDLGRDKSKYHGVALKAGYEKNTLGNQLYPMRGELIDANVIGLYEREKFIDKSGLAGNNGAEWAQGQYKNHWSLSAEILWKNFYRVHPAFTVGVMGNALATFSKPYQNYIATLIHAPAFAPTPSTKNYFNEAFRSNNYLAAGAMPIWNPLQQFQIRGDFYCYAPIRNLKQQGMECVYDGWFRKVEFIGEVAAVYNFKFASLSLYCNYLSYPARNWNFGINFGLLFQAPKFTR